ncbi:hypothetical protein Fcan01_15677 [Folsomia candida]|uniref:Uncharacterized protein n=1 Tax=Folsomia candida TaxID=158441 RepID=A0A226DUZ7_FOLCA|nr:hypothetical protein Fcan01_15677 [Folsomia candida]
MHYNCKTALKSLIILIFIQNPKFISPKHSHTNKESQPPSSWTSFLNSLNHCTIQVFFYQSSRPRWETISTLVDSVNVQLSLNFSIENMEDPKNRYIKSNSLTWGYRGIIPNYPFGQNNMTKLYSNCHIVQLLCSSLLLVTWGMTAFNEDADYILLLDRDPKNLPYVRVKVSLQLLPSRCGFFQCWELSMWGYQSCQETYIKELSVAKDIPIFTISSSTENNTNVSVVCGTMIPDLLNTSGYSETFLKMLRNVLARIQLIKNDNFAAAHSLSLNQPLYFNETRKLDKRPNIFAMMDHPVYMHDFHVSLEIF